MVYMKIMITTRYFMYFHYGSNILLWIAKENGCVLQTYQIIGENTCFFIVGQLVVMMYLKKNKISCIPDNIYCFACSLVVLMGTHPNMFVCNRQNSYFFDCENTLHQISSANYGKAKKKHRSKKINHPKKRIEESWTNLGRTQSCFELAQVFG